MRPGEISYAVREQEKQSLRFRRSLYIVEDMEAGDEFTEKLAHRPGLLGLPPKYCDIILGGKIKKMCHVNCFCVMVDLVQ